MTIVPFNILSLILGLPTTTIVLETVEMPYRHIVDEAGDKLRILDIDGYYAPTFDLLNNHEAEVRSIPDWKCRPDDVYICAYPKAGI